jgi:hypothetical protein
MFPWRLFHIGRCTNAVSGFPDNSDFDGRRKVDRLLSSIEAFFFRCHGEQPHFNGRGDRKSSTWRLWFLLSYNLQRNYAMFQCLKDEFFSACPGLLEISLLYRRSCLKNLSVIHPLHIANQKAGC